MNNDPMRAPGRARDALGLAAFVALCFGAAALGGLVTAQSVTSWYPTLNKPAFTPPDWVFGPAWTLLYLMIALAGWRVWRARWPAGARTAMIWYAVQLILNVAWSFIFFGARSIGFALVEIVVLLTAIVVSVVMFWRIDRLAGLLLVPYAAWVSFASVLNFALWRLN
jgi:tryptophan-rich sensory protein